MAGQTQMTIETVLNDRATIGESPLWVPQESALYWVDIKGPELNRLLPETGARKSWNLPCDIGGFALLEGDGALVALRSGLHRLDLGSGGLELLAQAPYDPALFRFNEAICDAAGRFWVGVMYDPLHGKGAGPGTPGPKGRLHSFTFAGGLREEPDRSDLHNGMAWSADGSRFFLAHSDKQTIYCFDYAIDEGLLTNQRSFAAVPAKDGLPDGAAMDTRGGYWCALHGGGRLRRFHADGTIDRDIVLPVSQPTMCAFGGADLATLYVTSASDQLSEEQKQREPLAGALFSLRPGETGIPRPVYAQ